MVKSWRRLTLAGNRAMRHGAIAGLPSPSSSPPPADLHGARVQRRAPFFPQLLQAFCPQPALLPSRSLRLSSHHHPAPADKAGSFPSALRSRLCAPPRILGPPTPPPASAFVRQVADGASLSLAEPAMAEVSEEPRMCEICEIASFADVDFKNRSVSGACADPLVSGMALRRQGEVAKPVASFSASDVRSFHSVPVASQQHEVVIALGSNMGDRVASFDKALSMMRRAGVDVICHSNLYESAPAYVTDQPKFLNAAVRASTRLDPSSLLGVLKGIERSLGRTVNGIRYGPRPIDLDILFYGDIMSSDENLTLPHPLIWERPFVLAPLMDLHSTKLSDVNHVWAKRYEKAKCAWQVLGGDNQLSQDGLRRVVPIGGKLWNFHDRTYVMGIINVTPDSFSDGGKHFTVRDAVSQAEALVQAGADIIDLGAQSTRPFAAKLTADEELGRLIPVLESIKKLPFARSVWLSVDTFYSKVAREAVNHGVHIVNDVSGGSLDSDMYKTVAELGVPYVVMHMRGNPKTMLQEKNVQYEHVSMDVSTDLCENLRKAESSGIPAWRIIVDPGLGFSKTSEQNVRLLGELSTFRSGLGSWSFTAMRLPLLIGPSRKRFLGKICNLDKAEDRDTATIGAVVAGIAQGVDIVRLHNVKASVDAIRAADAIFKTRDLTRVSKEDGGFL